MATRISDSVNKSLENNFINNKNWFSEKTEIKNRKDENDAF
jgi:hypothetical protein